MVCISQHWGGETKQAVNGSTYVQALRFRAVLLGRIRQQYGQVKLLPVMASLGGAGIALSSSCFSGAEVALDILDPPALRLHILEDNSVTRLGNVRPSSGSSLGVAFGWALGTESMGNRTCGNGFGFSCSMVGRAISGNDHRACRERRYRIRLSRVTMVSISLSTHILSRPSWMLFSKMVRTYVSES